MAERHLAGDFGKPPPRRRRHALGKRIKREEAALDNFHVGQLRLGLAHPATIERHVIAAAGAAIEIDGDQFRLADEFQIAFFAEFLDQRIGKRFVAFDATAGHMPARHVGMAHQEHPANLVECGGTNTQRHAPGDGEPDMQHAGHHPRPPVAHFGRPQSLVIDGLRCFAGIAIAHIMFRLAHISDIHLGPLPKVTLAELASKRITGYVNWHRNRRKHLFGNTLERVVAGLHAAAPDHVAITGDLVNLATRTEIEVARLWLETHFDPHKTTFVPGNHDAYVPGALAAATAAWWPWLVSDEKRADGLLFPSYRRRGPVALIGLSTANATLPFMATGDFGHKQARAAGELLEQAKRDGLFRAVMIHHPPVRGAAQWYKRMHGIGHFSTMLKQHGAELVLHGHTHLDTLHYLKGHDGPVPVVGIASASQGPGGHKPLAGYNLFEIVGEPGNWHISHRRMQLGSVGPDFVENPAGLISFEKRLS